MLNVIYTNYKKLPTILILHARNQCLNGKKEEPERSVSERRRREASRESSAEVARSLNAARGLGERCELPQRFRAGGVSHKR